MRKTNLTFLRIIIFMTEELRRRLPRKLCLQRNPKRRVRRLLENSDGPFKRRSARRTAVGCRVVVVFETSLGQRAFKGKRASERVGGQEEKERKKERELMSIENFHSLLCLSLSSALFFIQSFLSWVWLNSHSSEVCFVEKTRTNAFDSVAFRVRWQQQQQQLQIQQQQQQF